MRNILILLKKKEYVNTSIDTVSLDTDEFLDETICETPHVIVGKYAYDNNEHLFKEPSEHSCANWQLIVKQGYFMPHDKWLKFMLNSYCRRTGGYFVEGALRYRLCDALFLELNGSWFKHEGRSIVQVLSTTINGVTRRPVSTNLCLGEKLCYKLPTAGLGLKYFWDICDDCLNIFGGAGFKAFFMRSTNCSQGCCTHESQNCLGGFVGGGIQFKPFCGFILEGFVDYLIKTLQPSKCNNSCRVDLGGLVAGVGIGYQF